MVDFKVEIDTKQVADMLKRYQDKAVIEYTKALNNASIYGQREVMKASVVVTGALKNSWKWRKKNGLISEIYNSIRYVNLVISGRGPVVAKPGKVLVFKLTKFKGTAKTTKDTRQLMSEYKSAMKKLKNAKKVTSQTGIVVTKKVKATRPNDFITPVLPKITDKLLLEVSNAHARLVA